MDLFTPVVPPNRMHQNFVRTLADTAASVRNVLTSWATGFVDRDGKFVLEFQTTYNSSFWELYLFAVLKEASIEVNFSHSAPDFVCQNLPMAIEAVIASHAHDDVPEWEKTMKGMVHDDLEGAYRQSIIRMSNAFLSKEQKFRSSYAALRHMPGKAFVIAMSNYGTQDFNMLGDVAMQRLLYDVWEEERVLKANGAPVDVGLFRSPRFSHVSVLLYSSVATFGKARVLGNENGQFLVHAVRIKDNITPLHIYQPIQDYSESLTDGLRLFVNPYADVPIDLNVFDDPGIRVFLPERDESISVSCHSHGDLCLRIVQHLVLRE